MEFFSYLVLILLSLLAYSGGAVWRAGKAVDLKPQALDLVIVIILWAAAIASRLGLAINRWLLVLAWIVVSLVSGYLVGAFRRRLRLSKPEKAEAPRSAAVSFLRRIWETWKGFSRRMGGFQSRILLSFFFFLIITPFALIIRFFSDPLGIRPRSTASYWLEKKRSKADLEELRRQF